MVQVGSVIIYAKKKFMVSIMKIYAMLIHNVTEISYDLRYASY